MAIARLSDRFREDIRRAATVESTSVSADASAKLLVSLDGSMEVQYTQSGRGVDRQLRHGDDVIARDRYQLPSGAKAEWMLQQIEDIQLARMDLTLESADQPLFRIVAEVGRHRNATTSTESNE